MSVSLFDAVSPSGSAQGAPAGAIEVMFDEQNQPCFKRDDIGRFLGLADVARTFKNIVTKPRLEMSRPEHPLLTRSRMLKNSLFRSGMLKNPHDAFVDLEGALEIVLRSRKPKAVESVSYTHLTLPTICSA